MPKLESNLQMIAEASAKIDEVIEEVNWKMLTPEPNLTITFIEAKARLEAGRDKLNLVKNCIVRAINKTDEEMK